jgi:hypothetical protein
LLRPNRPGDLARFWKATDLSFGEHETTIDDDLEDTVLALDQSGVGAELALELCRQPGGTRFVVSNNAVLDADIHGYS